GGQTIQADAPVGRMPVFVKEGSIIPAGPEIQYVNEKPADPLTLYVYTGKDASFTLYEDEGVNYQYEEGKYATISIKYDEATKTLTIGEREGTFPGMKAERKIQVVWVRKDQPIGVNIRVQPNQVIDYTGKEVTI